MTRLDPVHPGEVLKHDFMAPFDLSDTALARAIGVTPARINEIVRGRRGITAETALRLARYHRTTRGRVTRRRRSDDPDRSQFSPTLPESAAKAAIPDSRNMLPSHGSPSRIGSE